MLYDLVNPSDAVTFVAPDLKIAACVTILLGGGQYGADPIEEGAESVPIMIFGNGDAWWTEHFDEPRDGVVERHADAIAEALRTVCYGGSKTRALFDSALAAIDDPEKKAAFVAEWNDRHRTSLNNIMGRAQDLAARVEAIAAKKQPA